MSAPGNGEVYYSLREAVCTGDLVAVEKILLLESGAGSVSDVPQREEILIYCFASAETFNAPDVEKIQMWYVVSTAWSDSVRALAAKLLEPAINMAPIEIFEEVLQLLEETTEPMKRESLLRNCATSARTPAHASKRKAAYDRAVAELKQEEGSAAKGKGKV